MNIIEEEEEEFLFWNSPSVNIKDLDTVLADPDLVGQNWDFDIDSDGKNDFRVDSEVLDSPFIQYWPGFSIHSLHSEFRFSGEAQSDTLFKATQIILENLDSGEIIKKTNIRYDCVRTSPEDQILSINESSLILDIYSVEEELDSLSDFVVGSLLLNKMYVWAPREDIITNDTLFYNSMRFRNECSVFPESELVHIVVQLGQKIGWIKLGVFGDRFLLIDKIALEK